MATPTIKELLDDLRGTLASVSGMKAVVRPPEQVPPDGPFALVEFAGASVSMGNLEETTFSIKATVCVPALGAYPQECETVEAAVPAVLTALRGNVALAGEAVLLPGIEIGPTQTLRYADVVLVGVAVTVQAQAWTERVNEYAL